MDRTIINIGRQFGAGGLEIASLAGEMLGIPVYDKQLICKAAQKSGFSEEFFERRDEKRILRFLQNIFSNGRVMGTGQNYLGDESLFKVQSAVIREIAEKESAIFVGRASNYILRDLPCLDVYICAPLPNRIRRIAERKGISPAEAENLIQKVEKSRREFYNFFTFGEWGGASDYDLCLNSSVLGIKGTAEYIVEFAKKAGIAK